MKLLVLGGTSDTHNFLKNSESTDYLITVATEYGLETFSKIYGEKVLHIRFDNNSLPEFIKKHQIEKIVDTTHPFAFNITELAEKTAKTLGIPYENNMRELNLPENFEGLHIAESFSGCAKYLKENNFAKILLTTGSNRLEEFSDVIHKCKVRVLPYEKSIQKCLNCGVEHKDIIAMQGPFSKNFNIALINETETDVLVTKLSGKSGGFEEKINACIETGIACVVITGQ
jgi:precorrin-6A/cobalt-precorrin-6A reductase